MNFLPELFAGALDEPAAGDDAISKLEPADEDEGAAADEGAIAADEGATAAEEGATAAEDDEDVQEDEDEDVVDEAASFFFEQPVISSVADRPTVSTAVSFPERIWFSPFGRQAVEPPVGECSARMSRTTTRSWREVPGLSCWQRRVVRCSDAFRRRTHYLRRCMPNRCWN